MVSQAAYGFLIRAERPLSTGLELRCVGQEHLDLLPHGLTEIDHTTGSGISIEIDRREPSERAVIVDCNRVCASLLAIRRGREIRG